MLIDFKTKRFSLFAFLLFSVLIFNSCDDDESVPPVETPEEIITDVILTFTDAAGNTVTAMAQDPDGEGVEDIVATSEINLSANTGYTLSIQLWNGLEEPAEDIAAEVAEEDDEHQFFFGYSTGAFTDPDLGVGNIAAAGGLINYLDEDDNGNPLGLLTAWTTAITPFTDRSFTVRLQHQPDIKTATTTADDGDTDVEVTFVLNVQ